MAKKKSEETQNGVETQGGAAETPQNGAVKGLSERRARRRKLLASLRKEK